RVTRGPESWVSRPTISRTIHGFAACPHRTEFAAEGPAGQGRLVHSTKMPQLVDSILAQLGQLFGPFLDQVRPNTLLDIGITALLIYWLFSLIRGTRAVRLVLGVSGLFALYVVAQWLDLRMVTQILQTGAVVGIFAFVVVFQPELRRGLERIGRVGSFAWLISPAQQRVAEHVATEVAHAAADLSAQG